MLRTNTHLKREYEVIFEQRISKNVRKYSQLIGKSHYKDNKTQYRPLGYSSLYVFPFHFMLHKSADNFLFYEEVIINFGQFLNTE